MKALAIIATIAACVVLAGCNEGQSKFNAANTAGDAFLQACIYKTIDYQITGDNMHKTFTVSCSVQTNVDDNGN